MSSGKVPIFHFMAAQIKKILLWEWGQNLCIKILSLNFILLVKTQEILL